MTHTLERAGPVRTCESRKASQLASTDTRRTPWWPLRVVVWFLFFAWPRYLGLDPTKALVPIRPNVAAQHPPVAAHRAFGTVAPLTVVLMLDRRWLNRTANKPILQLI